MKNTMGFCLILIALLTTTWACTAAINVKNNTTSVVEYLVPYEVPGTQPAALSDELSIDKITQVANHVADWQLAQFDIRSNKMRTEIRPSGLPAGWMYATFNIGLQYWATVSNDPTYKQSVINLSLLNGYKPGPRIYHADDHAIADVYLSLYDLYGGEEKLNPILEHLTHVVENPDSRSLDFEVKERAVHEFKHRTFKDPYCSERWCWADAVFMSPPVFAHLSKITNDPRFLEFMHKEFWIMTDYLYDTDYDLYLRDSRYFTRLDKQGRRIFWGRGNGWVLAGLARTIDFIPETDPQRVKYIDLFKKLSLSLLNYQNPDGSWPSSLLEAGADAHSETSATGLLAFGLAWGINNEHLKDAKYQVSVAKAWQSIVKNIEPNGKVGYVQQVAYAPGSATKDDTQLYGSGAVLLAAAELVKLVNNK